MKTITIFTSLYFLTVFGYSQNTLKDTAITFTSDQIKLSYSPTDLFTSISISTNKFENGKIGIEFFLIAKPRQKTPIIRIDSIILKLSSDKILILNSPYRDTVFYRNDGGLSLIAIHQLDKNDLAILKQDLITTIIMIVNAKQQLISLRNKSRKEIKDLLNTTQ